jgi:hypothetical protein
MKMSELLRIAPLAAVIAGVPVSASAASSSADPTLGEIRLSQASQPAQPAPPGTMDPGMMGQGMIGHMMGHMMGHGMMGHGMIGAMGVRGHMLKVMFAIADADGDGALSFEEVTAIHKRVFDKVDANKDSKVTPEEFQAFMRD